MSFSPITEMFDVVIGGEGLPGPSATLGRAKVSGLHVERRLRSEASKLRNVFPLSRAIFPANSGM